MSKPLRSRCPLRRIGMQLMVDVQQLQAIGSHQSAEGVTQHAGVEPTAIAHKQRPRWAVQQRSAQMIHYIGGMKQLTHPRILPKFFHLSIVSRAGGISAGRFKAEGMPFTGRLAVAARSASGVQS